MVFKVRIDPVAQKKEVLEFATEQQVRDYFQKRTEQDSYIAIKINKHTGVISGAETYNRHYYVEEI